ncbi:MAG: hypothetical protein QN732_10830, partial [Nitrososphaeraceae archaeon]|nr:hypothetical protein [Nitrososphaeraceae archaeon]
ELQLIKLLIPRPNFLTYHLFLLLFRRLCCLALDNRIYHTPGVGGSSQNHLALIDQATQTELQVYFIIPEKLLN